MPPPKTPDEQLKVLLAYVQCAEGGKVDWKKAATVLGVSSGPAVQARFNRLVNAYKDVSLKVGDGHAKNGRGPTAIKSDRVTKKRKANGSASASTSADPDGAANGVNGNGGTRRGRGGGRAKGHMDKTFDSIPIKGENSDDEDDEVSVKSEGTEVGIEDVSGEEGVEV